MTKQAEASSTTENYELENYIRRCYIWERRHHGFRYKGQADLGDYMPGAHWDGQRGRKSIWPTLARFFSNNDFPPHEYIRHQFETMQAVFETPPYPNQLTSRAAIEQYKQAVNDEVGTLQAAHASSALKIKIERSGLKLAFLDAEVTEDECLESALLGTRDVSPVFKYVEGHRFGFNSVIEEMGDSAAMYYMRAKTAYDVAWGDYINDKVKFELEDRYWEILDEIPGL